MPASDFISRLLRLGLSRTEALALANKCDFDDCRYMLALVSGEESGENNWH